MHCSGISDEAGQPIDAQIKAHKELGWDYIELRNIDKVNLTDVPDETFEEILGKVTDADLKISCFASQLCNWSRPITGDFQLDVDELGRTIPRMQKAGTEFIRIMSYPNDKDNPLPDDQWRDEAVRRIKHLARMAEDGGIMLAHENCNGWGGEGPENSLRLLELVDSPALCLLYDTGNPVGHGQDPWAYFRGIREKIAYVHVKDGVFKEEGGSKWRFCGEGDGKVPEVVQSLVDNGYDGFISIEPHVSAIVHLDKDAQDPQVQYDSYIKYGRMLMDIINNAEAAAGK
ncbi:MAG: sugar phosphate isomerase/epimerase family protein [Planctomycetota bacterium]